MDNETNETILRAAVELLNDEDERGEKFSTNIRTEIRVQVDVINIKTGKGKLFFNVDTFYTGGNREKSKANVLKKIKKQAQKKLREL